MVIIALVGFALTTQRTTTQLYVLWGMLKYVFIFPLLLLLHVRGVTIRM